MRCRKSCPRCTRSSPLRTISSETRSKTSWSAYPTPTPTGSSKVKTTSPTVGPSWRCADMKCTVLIALLGILALSLGTPSQAWSQWSLSLGVEADRFWGGSLEEGPEQKSFRPYRPTVFGVGAEHRFGSLGLGLRATYTEAALGLEGEAAVVAVKDAFT